MTILNDKHIKALAEAGAITPFHPESSSFNSAGRKVPSYGLSSFGYDVTLGNTFKTLKVMSTMAGNGHFIDPSDLNENLFLTSKVTDEGIFVMQPGACVLAHTRERFDLPRDILTICMQKSTLARCFSEVTVTPAEPEWQGYLTLELHNKTTFPVYLRPGMGIAQMLFFRGEPCETSYADRKGKYQDQPAEPVIAR